MGTKLSLDIIKHDEFAAMDLQMGRMKEVMSRWEDFRDAYHRYRTEEANGKFEGKPSKFVAIALPTAPVASLPRKRGKLGRYRRTNTEVKLVEAAILTNLQDKRDRKETAGTGIREFVALGFSLAELRLPLSNLRRGGYIRAKGKRRGMRYFFKKWDTNVAAQSALPASSP